MKFLVVSILCAFFVPYVISMTDEEKAERVKLRNKQDITMGELRRVAKLNTMDENENKHKVPTTTEGIVDYGSIEDSPAWTVGFEAGFTSGWESALNISDPEADWSAGYDAGYDGCCDDHKSGDKSGCDAAKK